MYSPNPGRGQASWSEAALRVASRRAKFIPPLEAEGFLWLFCKANHLNLNNSRTREVQHSRFLNLAKLASPRLEVEEIKERFRLA